MRGVCLLISNNASPAEMSSRFLAGSLDSPSFLLMKDSGKSKAGTEKSAAVPEQAKADGKETGKEKEGR